jgi:L-2-hydroxyglutarate oxidase
MYRFCQEHGIAHEQCGKLVVATDSSELPALATLEERGQANGLRGVRRLKPEEINEFEPHVTGIAGLLVPETGIVNYTQVAEVYAQQVRQSNGVIQTGTRLLGCQSRSDELVLSTSQGDIRCRYLINCGGLQSDRIARLCGLDPGLKIVPFRGEYYELLPQAHYLVKNLIYPVPNPQFPFLGVHFTRMIQGGVEAGPNAVLAYKREGYRHAHFSPTDFWEVMTYQGFWRLAGQYWRTGLGEFYRSFSKRAFVQALQKLVPELNSADIHPAGSGVRAQALTPDGRLVDDFRIVEAPRMIHVLNAPSPAATASLSIGQTIARMAQTHFELR